MSVARAAVGLAAIGLAVLAGHEVIQEMSPRDPSLNVQYGDDGLFHATYVTPYGEEHYGTMRVPENNGLPRAVQRALGSVAARHEARIVWAGDGTDDINAKLCYVDLPAEQGADPAPGPTASPEFRFLPQAVCAKLEPFVMGAVDAGGNGPVTANIAP